MGEIGHFMRESWDGMYEICEDEEEVGVSNETD